MTRYLVCIAVTLLFAVNQSLGQLELIVDLGYTQMQSRGNNATAEAVPRLDGWSANLGLTYNGIVAGLRSDRGGASTIIDNTALPSERWSQLRLRSIYAGYQFQLVSDLSLSLTYSISSATLYSQPLFSGNAHGPGSQITFDLFDPIDPWLALYIFGGVDYRRILYDDLIAPASVLRYYQRSDVVLFRLGAGVRFDCVI
jgi:hypothetical protein